MRGVSQHDSTNRGEDVWSIAVHLVSALYGWYEGASQCRLKAAISRLCVVVLVHRDFRGDRRAVGSSIIEGRRIFSIEGG